MDSLIFISGSSSTSHASSMPHSTDDGSTNQHQDDNPPPNTGIRYSIENNPYYKTAIESNQNVLRSRMNTSTESSTETARVADVIPESVSSIANKKKQKATVAGPNINTSSTITSSATVNNTSTKAGQQDNNNARSAATAVSGGTSKQLYQAPPLTNAWVHPNPANFSQQMVDYYASEVLKCRDRLHNQIKEFSFRGILRCSLHPDLSGNAFETLEFYGDAVLQERITKLLFFSRRFMTPSVLSPIRQSCVNNKTLATVFDELQLDQLATLKPADMEKVLRYKLSPYQSHKATVFKPKADVVEAVIGELVEAMNNPCYSSVSSTIGNLLEDILSFICYVGERIYFTSIVPQPRHTAIGTTASAAPSFAPAQPSVSASQRPPAPLRPATTVQSSAVSARTSTTAGSGNKATSVPPSPSRAAVTHPSDGAPRYHILKRPSTSPTPTSQPVPSVSPQQPPQPTTPQSLPKQQPQQQQAMQPPVVKTQSPAVTQTTRKPSQHVVAPQDKSQTSLLLIGDGSQHPLPQTAGPSSALMPPSKVSVATTTTTTTTPKTINTPTRTTTALLTPQQLMLLATSDKHHARN